MSVSSCMKQLNNKSRARLHGTCLIAVIVLFSMLCQACQADQVPVSPKPAPEISGGTWLNGRPEHIRMLKGKVIVLLFWTRGCINCKHNLPIWNRWAKTYQGSDVAVLSVHTPEIPEDSIIPILRKFVAARQLAFPVVTDNTEQIWNDYGVDAWPTEILIDKTGTIRYKFEGELNWQGDAEYKTVEKLIDQLRTERQS